MTARWPTGFLLFVDRGVMTGLPVTGRTLRFDRQRLAVWRKCPDVDQHHLATLLEGALALGIADAPDRDRIGIRVAGNFVIQSVIRWRHFPVLRWTFGRHHVHDDLHPKTCRTVGDRHALRRRTRAIFRFGWIQVPGPKKLARHLRPESTVESDTDERNQHGGKHCWRAALHTTPLLNTKWAHDVHGCTVCQTRTAV